MNEPRLPEREPDDASNPDDPADGRDDDASTPDDSSGRKGREERAGAHARGSESEALFRSARQLEQEGRFREAVETYRRLLARDPAHVRARNNLGVLHDRLGSHDSALEHFRAALEIDPENPELLMNVGAALGALARFDEAERELRHAMRIDPARADVRANLGILYFRRGLYHEAVNELRWVCDHEADHGTAHFYLGEALNRLGRVDAALEALEQASRLQPRNPKIFYVMGILYDRKHLPNEAAAMYRRARELSGASS